MNAHPPEESTETSSLISLSNQNVSENTDKRGGFREGAGRKPGVRLPCGACGASLTAEEWIRHFARCPDRPRPSKTRVLFSGGKWRVPTAKRPEVKAEGEIIERRPATSYDLFAGRTQVCACGATYTGPPNKRACDKCRRQRQ